MMTQPMLQEIADMSFDPSNLWMLHQYYYSPSAPDAPCAHNQSEHEAISGRGGEGAEGTLLRQSIHGEPNGLCAGNGAAERRPTKRRGNKMTMTRIAEYPRIQVLYNDSLIKQLVGVSPLCVDHNDVMLFCPLEPYCRTLFWLTH